MWYKTRHEERTSEDWPNKVTKYVSVLLARNPQVRKKFVFSEEKQQLNVEGEGRKESSFCFVSPTDY